MDETGTIYTPNLVEFAVAEPVPPDDTCRTCRFWERIDTGLFFGHCNIPGETMPFIRGIIGIRNILFPQTFGCRFHRPKEAG